jgi:hypothetical protein
LAAVGVVGAADGCGSSHDTRVGTNESVHYSGRLYSVRQVERAFAALGLKLHRAATRAPGVVSLVNNARLGPQHIPGPPQLVTVVVAARRRAADSTVLPKGAGTSVTRYANITVFAKPDALGQARAAVSALRWGTASNLGKPGPGSIVLASSMNGIRLGESRATVEKTFGPGRTTRRGLVSYFGGRLLVDYWFHDRLYDVVEYVGTRWSGYRHRSGVHVGSTRRDLRALYVTCTEEDCSLPAGPMPDAVGTDFTMRHGRVVEIAIGYFG